jgi:hypothetical protein
LRLLGTGSEAQDQILGVATRAGTQNSEFNVAAPPLLQAVVEHSPAPSVVANEFLTELKRCGIATVAEFGNAHFFLSR